MGFYRSGFIPPPPEDKNGERLLIGDLVYVAFKYNFYKVIEFQRWNKIALMNNGEELVLIGGKDIEKVMPQSYVGKNELGENISVGDYVLGQGGRKMLVMHILSGGSVMLQCVGTRVHTSISHCIKSLKNVPEGQLDRYMFNMP